MSASFWLAASQAKELAVHHCMVDGVATRVVQAGDHAAPPVVCLHGTGGHAEAFIHNLAPLSRNFHVLAYDLPGHGWSSAPERSYEIDGYRRHLDALLDTYGLGQAVLVGQSLGGWIAAAHAVAEPDRVSRLILVGAGGKTFDPAIMEHVRTASMAAVVTPSAEVIRNRVNMLFAQPIAADAELVACRQAIYSRRGAIEAMTKALTLQIPEIRSRNLFTRWSEIRQPTLAVWGQDDQLIPLSSGKEITDAIPNSRLVVLQDSGHWPQFEQAQVFNETLLAFLAEPLASLQQARP